MTKFFKRLLILVNKSEYDGYFRDYINVKDFSVSEEYVNSVLTSPANQAIKKIKNVEIRKEEIYSLRKNNRITCESLNRIANCSNLCLFNLSEDPCETTDVSSQHPKASQILTLYFILKSYLLT